MQKVIVVGDYGTTAGTPLVGHTASVVTSLRAQVVPFSYPDAPGHLRDITDELRRTLRQHAAPHGQMLIIGSGFGGHLALWMAWELAVNAPRWPAEALGGLFLIDPQINPVHQYLRRRRQLMMDMFRHAVFRSFTYPRRDGVEVPFTTTLFLDLVKEEACLTPERLRQVQLPWTALLPVTGDRGLTSLPEAEALLGATGTPASQGNLVKLPEAGMGDNLPTHHLARYLLPLLKRQEAAQSIAAAA